MGGSNGAGAAIVSLSSCSQLLSLASPFIVIPCCIHRNESPLTQIRSQQSSATISQNFGNWVPCWVSLPRIGLGNWRSRELERFLRVQRFSVFARDWIEVVSWSLVSEVIELRKGKRGIEGKGNVGRPGDAIASSPVICCGSRWIAPLLLLFLLFRQQGWELGSASAAKIITHLCGE